jgi:hypothetical protein
LQGFLIILPVFYNQTYRKFKRTCSGKARLATTLLKATEGLIQAWFPPELPGAHNHQHPSGKPRIFRVFSVFRGLKLRFPG